MGMQTHLYGLSLSSPCSQLNYRRPSYPWSLSSALILYCAPLSSTCLFGIVCAIHVLYISPQCCGPLVHIHLSAFIWTTGCHTHIAYCVNEARCMLSRKSCQWEKISGIMYYTCTYSTQTLAENSNEAKHQINFLGTTVLGYTGTPHEENIWDQATRQESQQISGIYCKSLMVPSHHQSSRAGPTKIIRMKDHGPLTTLTIQVERWTVTIPGFICFYPGSPQLSMFNVDLMTPLWF
jgi:hypothetical protein